MRQGMKQLLILCWMPFVSGACSNFGFVGELRYRLEYAADHGQRLSEVEVDGWRVEAFLDGGGSLGYVVTGVVPDYACSPDGVREPCTFMHKRL